MIELGVNVDHVATLREARKGVEPDVVEAALVAQRAGAHQITAHLRQDRRHMQDRDIHALTEALDIHLNLEMAAVEEIIGIAHQVKPYTVCLVPEKRQEVTTEGGLDVAGQQAYLTGVVSEMHDNGIKVSLFIDPDAEQVGASAATGADAVELHTGAYANAGGSAVGGELARLEKASALVRAAGLALHAGHGLTVANLGPVARIPGLREVNIGHSIIARAIFIGLDAAVRELLDALGSGS